MQKANTVVLPNGELIDTTAIIPIVQAFFLKYPPAELRIKLLQIQNIILYKSVGCDLSDMPINDLIIMIEHMMMNVSIMTEAA